jgi:hypothetical protein
VLFTEFKSKIVVYKPVKKLLLYYILIIITSFWGLTKQSMFSFDTYEVKLKMNILQYAIIYFPVCWLLTGSNHLGEYKYYFKKALILLAAVNSVWGIIQFAFWAFWRVDFNSLVFVDILHGVLGTQWTTYSQVVDSGVLDYYGAAEPPVRCGVSRRNIQHY